MAAKSDLSHSGSALHRAARVARAEGARGLVRRAAVRWRRAFGLVSGYVMRIEIDPDHPLGQGRPGWRVQRVGAQDGALLAELARVYEVPATVEGLQSWLERGELLYAAWIDGRLAGYMWVLPNGVVTDFGKPLLPLRPDEVYYHDAYVLPEQRGKNVCPVVQSISARELFAENGKRHMLSFIETKNKSSLRAVRKLGAQRCGRVGYVKLFGRKLPFMFRHRPMA